ncbi:MAG TPA: hypothetical protein VLZ30_05335 [Verrucomicrobiae bacterium]|nr:hypothetical protein [Verrucomicrobiae bacterium]
MFPFIIIVCLVGGVVNFLLSARFAEVAGVTMRDVIGVCFSEPSPTQQYSGEFLKAAVRFSIGTMEVFFALLQASFMAIAWKLHKRNTRVLRFIEEKRS